MKKRMIVFLFILFILAPMFSYAEPTKPRLIAQSELPSIQILVNKKNALPSNYVPPDLVAVNIPFSFKGKSPKKTMRKEAAKALEKLFVQARKEGIELVGVSGYRSYQVQKEIYNRNVKIKGVKEANRVSAQPGQSEHQTGLAMDVSYRRIGFVLEEFMGSSKEGKWLDKHASNFGFIIRYPKGKESITGYTYEPWHLRYVGVKEAKEVTGKAITFDEYAQAAKVLANGNKQELPVPTSRPAYQVTNVSVCFNGKPLTFEQNPVIVKGRTLVALRPIFEALGAEVAWDGSTQTVMAVKGDDTIKLTLGSNTAYKNGEAITTDVPPISIHGRTMVPARFAANTLGAMVGWNAATNTVAIDTVAQELTAEVTEVIEGDTIKVTINGQEENVKLIGVDISEKPYGPEASAYMKARLEGQTVRLEFDVQERDQNDHPLAYVWLGDEMINKTLIAEGYGVLASSQPNIKYVDDFTKLQEQAREAKKGLWGLQN